MDPKPWEGLLDAPGYADLYFERSAGRTLHWEDGRLEEVRDGADRGLGLRYLLPGGPGRPPRTFYGSANSWDLEQAKALGKRLLEGQKKVPSAARPWTFGRASHPLQIEPASIGYDDKIRLLKEADAYVRAKFPEVRQVSLTYAERSRWIAVLSSERFCREESRGGLMFVAHVVAEKDGQLQSGHEVLGSLKGFEVLDGGVHLRLAERAARRAVAKLSAPPAKAGEMPVVISNQAGGTLIHEAIGHSLEADHIQEGTSPAYHGAKGRQVAPEFLTIIDDPTLPYYRGSYAYDDEGMETRPTVLVENGVLKDFLYDKLTSEKDGSPNNAHGRRESYHHRPIPRMSNLYIAPGKDDPAAILKSLKKGLFVTRMGGGQVNTATGEFMFEIDEGYYVEDGKIRHMVRDANLLGVGPDVLKSIDMLGWDIGWAIGVCGKDGQSVPVADGQPTLRIPNILVGGRSE